MDYNGNDINPIHKLDNGNNVTLCNSCRKIICNGFLPIIYCQDCDENQITYNYYLFRLDGLSKRGNKITWALFDENNVFKQEVYEPKINSCLILNFYNNSYSWMTTKITEIIEVKDTHIKFKTKNSEYVLFKYEKRN